MRGEVNADVTRGKAPYLLRKVPAGAFMTATVANCNSESPRQPNSMCGLVVYNGGQHAHLFWCGVATTTSAAGITQSGLAGWLGEALEPLSVVHPIIIALALTALVILITEFASNVATASGVLPVVAGLVAATGADPWLMAMAASMAASWGFMMPSGTGPNAIAWASGHIALPKMVKAGFYLDLAGIPLIVGAVWLIGALRAL
jgi:di/tricarboxylate transporter